MSLESTKELLQKLGGGLEFEQFLDHCVKENLQQCSPASYYQWHKEMFGMSATRYRRTNPDLIPTILPKSEVPVIKPKPMIKVPELPDTLSHFIRFSTTVEGIGGIGIAEHYLNILKSLQGKL